MRIAYYVRARLQRQINVHSLGPNEGRILYDGGAGVIGLAVVLGFSSVYLGRSDFGQPAPLFALPFLLLIFNAAFGIYSRMRMSSGNKKALALLAGVAASGASALLLGAASAPVVLWVFVVYPPLALARLLLGLPYSRHRRLISIAVNHRGPVLVIGGAGYIGSHTVDLLLRSGHQVRVLDRLMYGRESLADFAGNQGFRSKP